MGLKLGDAPRQPVFIPLAVPNVNNPVRFTVLLDHDRRDLRYPEAGPEHEPNEETGIGPFRIMLVLRDPGVKGDEILSVEDLVTGDLGYF